MYAYVKRLLDIALAAALLVLATPLMGGIAVVLVFDRPGNSLFSQARVGKNDKIFTIYKFRTISEKTDKNSAPAITPFCAFLRAWSLDELPQLWNVLKGDMSFVGPRPVVPTETALLARRRALGATHVRPGLTGLAQVRGRKRLSAEDKARCDAYYCKCVSFSLDIYIVWRTLFCLRSDEPMSNKKPLTNR